MVLVWFLLALIALLGELFTMSFYAVYEAVAAALVGVLALILPSFILQVVAFAIFSAVLLGLLALSIVPWLYQETGQWRYADDIRCCAYRPLLRLVRYARRMRG